jgi:hypothetical protein
MTEKIEYGRERAEAERLAKRLDDYWGSRATVVVVAQCNQRGELVSYGVRSNMVNGRPVGVTRPLHLHPNDKMMI